LRNCLQPVASRLVFVFGVAVPRYYSRLECRHASRLAAGLACLCALLAVTGCVQRRLTIRSNPPGATCYVDNVEIGATPVSHDFLYYGTREIKLVKAGYETLTVLQPIPYAWYQVPPLDFISDNLTPWEIRDERDFSYNLAPQRDIPAAEVLGRAEGLRGTAMAPPGAAIAPPSPVLPAPPIVGPPLDINSGPAVMPDGIRPIPPATGAVPPVLVPPQPQRPRRLWPTPAT
jgi:hypothetical protein